MAHIDSAKLMPSARPRGWSRAGGEAELSVSLIGPVSASAAGRQANLRFRKAAAILGYLCLQDRMAERRERLANLLWSENEEQKARGSLRQVIALLRRELSGAGFDGLSTSKLTIALDQQRVDVDLLNALRAADRWEVHSLLLTHQRLPERILEGLEDLDDEFRTWLLPMRQAIHNRLERTLSAGLFDASVSAAEKFKIATALLGLDPTNERACRYIVEAHANWGDVAAAVRVFEQLSHTLSHEHGVRPSAETQSLIDQVQRGAFDRRPESTIRPVHAPPELWNKEIRPPSAPSPAPSPAAAAAAQKTIALRLNEFEMHGVALDKSYLVGGFRHELAACLVRFREWSVVESRAATPTTHAAPVMAEYRLEGTAYQAGSAINMVLTLLDVSRASYIWSESFELRLDSWFAAQQRLVRRLTSTLNVHLTAERLKRMSNEPDVSVESYDKWLRAQALLSTFQPDNWERARSMLSDAKTADRQFAPLYCCVVQMSNMENLVFPGVLLEARKVESTVSDAKLAVQLGPLDSRAHLCLGWALAGARRFEAAEPHMSHAQELNDNDPWVTLSAASFWGFAGHSDRARGLLAESMGRSLFFVPREWAYCGVIRFLSEDYSGALDALDRAQDVTRTIAAWKAAAMAHLGRTEEAIQEGQRFLEGTRSHWFGAEPASDSAIARWLLQAHPIRRGEHWRLLRDGVRKAGIPVDGIDHHMW